MTQPFMTRGYMLSTALKYLREGLEPSRGAVALARLSPETIALLEGAKSAEWYPASHMTVVYDAIIAAANHDPVIAEHDLVGVGRFGASEAINTFLKLLMRVLTPQLFAKKLPSLYERDNSKGKVTVDVANHRLVCRIEDCKGCPHLGPTSVGWASFALEAMGKKLSTSTIRGWSLDDPDSGSIEFELHWKV